MPWSWYYGIWTTQFNQRGADFWFATPWEFWSAFDLKYPKEKRKPKMTQAMLADWIEKDLQRQRLKSNGNDTRRIIGKTPS